METYRTDEEQIEAVKQWWRENGLPIVVGLVIGLGGIFGWRGWQAWEQAQAEAASDIYQTMIHYVREKDADKARESALQLQEEYTSTTYAVYGALNMAKLAIDEGDLQGARKQLEYATRHAAGKELRLLAELRLARVMVAEGKLDEALALLENREFEQFTNAAAELKGDILTQQGKTEAAVKAYNMALAETEPNSNAYELLTLKLDSAGQPVTP